MNLPNELILSITTHDIILVRNEIAICTSTATKQVRYCQECATEMGRADLELRSLLDTKLKLVQDALAAIHLHTTTRGDTAKRDPNPAHNDVECSGENGGTGFTNETEAAGSSTDIDSAISLGSVPSTPSASHSSSDVNVKKHLTFDEIQRALVLHRTDAESLHTAIDAAQTKAVDTRIIEKAKKIYEQLSSHISLQEEVKALLASCPIAVRSLVDPLKNALQNARKDNVDPRMLYLVEKVIQSAEAEFTLFGAESLTSHITLGSKKYAKEIARLEAAILQAEQYGVTGTLLNNTIRLRNRLNAEVSTILWSCSICRF
jgi:hypothetical protein